MSNTFRLVGSEDVFLHNMKFFLVALVSSMVAASADGWLLGVGVFIAIQALPNYSLPRMVYGIRVSDPGIVTFPRVVGTSTLSVRDIQIVKGVRTAYYDGSVEWHMEIWGYAGCNAKVGYFHRAREFVADIKALNPRIEVTGEWPSIGFPESH